MSDAADLYQEAIKQIAAAAHAAGALAHPDAEARLSNPLCGDRVRVQVAFAGGRIAAFAHETRGCLLCRAGASVLGARALGMDRAQVDAAQAAMKRALLGETGADGDWPELAMFSPAKAFPSRHTCAMLPFQALQAAFAAVGDQR